MKRSITIFRNRIVAIDTYAVGNAVPREELAYSFTLFQPEEECTGVLFNPF